MAQDAEVAARFPRDKASGPSRVATWSVWFQRALLGLIGLGLTLLAGRYWAEERLNEAIRRRIEQVLHEHYAGLRVHVHSVRRDAGVGLRILGLRIAEGGAGQTPILVAIEELVVHCDARLPELWSGSVAIRGLEVRRPHLRAERKPSGVWNVALLVPLPHCGRSLPRVSVTDGVLEIIDPRQVPGGAWTLRELQGQVEPVSRGEQSWWQLRGSMRGEHLDRVDWEGWLDPQRGLWELRGTVTGLEFNPRLRSALPREVGELVAPLSSVRGRTFLVFQMRQTAAEAGTNRSEPRDGARLGTSERAATSPLARLPAPSVWFSIHGKIAEGRIDDARLPQPLTEVEAEIHCDPQGVEIRQLTARCGQAYLDLSGRIAGYDGCGPMDLMLHARQLPLDHWPPAALPEGLRRLWDRFQPQGLADIRGRLRFDGQRWLPELEIDCRPIALCYAGFPYPLREGRGTICLHPERARVDLRFMGGGQPVRCRAELSQPGADFSGWIEVEGEGGLPIDERLLGALPADAQRVVRAFRPRGSVQFSARFDRPAPGARLQRQMRILLEDCTIQHEQFPYPIDQVRGLLVLQGEDWFFRNLSGRNDSAQIVGEGSWVGQGPQRQLTLQLTAREVPLADELARALPPRAQRLWAALRPRGHLEHLRVLVRHVAPLGPWSVEVWAEQSPTAANEGGRTIALEPAAIRYPLHHVTGRLYYREGQLDLIGLRAQHGRTTLVADGVCRLLPEGGCHLTLTRCAADRLELDRELVAAWGEPLAAALVRFPLEGPLHAAGALEVLWPADPGDSPHLHWNLEVDLENACLLTSTPVAHLHGGIALSGRCAPEGLFTRGELRIDSAMLGPVQLTRLEGPFWSDGHRLVFGMLADRAPPGQVPRQVTARMLGGLLSLDGELGLAPGGTFQLQGTLENADLAQIVQELAPHQRGLTGKVFAQVQLAGQLEARHTWRGHGRVLLRDADIYELPLMVALLKLLSIQRPNRTAFTTSDIELRVEGDELALERIDFSGDVISLKGRGRLHHQQQIDLKFYPLVGREEWHLPLMRPLLGETGRELMLIQVTGTLDQPEIRRVPFPRLDAQWQQMFPELARDAAGRPPAWLTAPLAVPRAALQPLRNWQPR